jgi:ribosomal protein S18 acetylase RimI-like enzyme
MLTMRRAGLHDLPGSYRVCLLTGDYGADATALYRNVELLGHVFVGPYLVGQPDLAAVVADDDGVAGYVLGALDTQQFDEWSEANWWPPLREQYALRTDRSPEAELVARIHRPLAPPDDFLADYPSHLHIDLLERARGHGNGRRMLEWLLGTLREQRSPGVHLDVGTRNSNAIEFYRHIGFQDLQANADGILMGLRL